MKFKNEFEEIIYNIAVDIFGNKNIKNEHNKVIHIENKSAYSTVSFSGPPKKEVDVLSINLDGNLNINLLVSCKEFSQSKAEPSHVQEWCSVINTMNKHSLDSKYIGLVISSSGFTSGCEAWASSDNIGLIPPIKGAKISFEKEHITSMFKRFCTALLKRLEFPIDDLLNEPNLFDFCYSITSDFEGIIDADISSRYKFTDLDWNSNFSELVSSVFDKKIESISCNQSTITLSLSGGHILEYSYEGVRFGIDNTEFRENKGIPECTKGVENEIISFEEAKSLILGKRITSAADFQTYIEFGINNELNLALLSPNRLHLMIFDEFNSVAP